MKEAIWYCRERNAELIQFCSPFAGTTSSHIADDAKLLDI